MKRKNLLGVCVCACVCVCGGGTLIARDSHSMPHLRQLLSKTNTTRLILGFEKIIIIITLNCIVTVFYKINL